jgi:(heptosyl)LPS beta-1,4-glucosyltransferase
MRLGGFVIHGNNADTLEICLKSLCKVCDEVVAVDSGSNDGSALLVQRMGVRAVSYPWQGYGAARAAAVAALEGCDWLFYLDSDEWMEPKACAFLLQWKKTTPKAPGYRVTRNDWAELESLRFLYRRQHRARLVRSEAAHWAPRMIVHEALSLKNLPRLPICIEHRFATHIEGRARKEEFYALLWGLRAYAEGRKNKWPLLQRPAIFVRDTLLGGSLFRGGLPAARLAWQVAAYHQRKYERLAEFKRGLHTELVKTFEAGQFSRVFELARELAPTA